MKFFFFVIVWEFVAAASFAYLFLEEPFRSGMLRMLVWVAVLFAPLVIKAVIDNRRTP